MAEMIKLSSVEEALTLLVGESLPEGLKIEFDGELRTLEIEIEGPLFHGGITGEIARGLAELQEELYRAARFSITGKEGRDSRLTKEQKEQLELLIEVRKGCSLINVDIGKFGDGLVKILGDQVNNMTTGEVQFLVVACLALLAAGWIGKAAVIEHYKLKSLKAEKAETTTQLATAVGAQVEIVEKLAAVIASDKRVERFAEATASGLTQVAVRATDATSVKLGRVDLDEDELAAMRRRAPKSASETLHETGDFRVLHVDGTSNPFKLTLGGAAIPGEFTVEYDRNEFSTPDDEKIWKALRDQTHVRLEVKAEQLRDKIKGAVIVTIDPRTDRI